MSENPNRAVQTAHTKIYNSLLELRESFHRAGRLDDSNAKLDEVAKLFATYVSFRRGDIPSFPLTTSNSLVKDLSNSFSETTKLDKFILSDGTNVFGQNPSLTLQSEDSDLAKQIVEIVRDAVDTAFSVKTDSEPIDILNEAFGHFIRDNFRGNIEDAQYMTPPEVIDFMVKMVLHDIGVEDKNARDANYNWKIADPTCGVGSFLGSFYNQSLSSSEINPSQLSLYGQDKVERMVRLSLINLDLYRVHSHRISIGNSLEDRSAISDLDGEIDIILTNPPFGAKFDGEYLRKNCSSTLPFFSSLRKLGSQVESEILFVERNLTLLKDGGRLLIVVPDGVISARGTAAVLRQYLANSITIRAIIELPSVAFAQAGTRTRTAILYLQKKPSGSDNRVFIAVARDLGYEVSVRKGIQVKTRCGKNELPAILDTYVEQSTVMNCVGTTAPTVLRTSPSCTSVLTADLIRSSWTPSHHNSARLEAIAQLARSKAHDLVALGDLAHFNSEHRQTRIWTTGSAFISILHIVGENLLDIPGALNNAPKTAGIPVFPGELLFSKINPRIPRVCIVPNLGIPMLCSSEFEILTSKGSLNEYALALLMQSPLVKAQIENLTSGTSASHNRIRTSELATTLVPVSRLNSREADEFAATVASYQLAVDKVLEATLNIAQIRNRI
jgi:type I restriction-modification system DNA methylase subunit